MTSGITTAGQLAVLLGPEPYPAPAYRGLAERVRGLIMDGQLSPEVRLPSERELSRRLGLSRTTVASAYARLRDLGCLAARRGSGHYVILPRVRATSSYLPGAVRTEHDQLGWNCASSAAVPGIAAAFQRAAERLPALLAGSGYLPDGLDGLRERLAQWYQDRGLPTRPDQVIITTGALAAANIVLRACTQTGDRVLLESPTYPNTLEAVRRTGRRPVGYPLPRPGWQPAEFGQALRRTAPRLAYLIPEHQNPTGVWMSEPVRAGVANQLERHGVLGLIDETLVEVRLDGQPPRTPLAVLAPEAISIGSASKTYWGGLRVGWIRAPRSQVRALIEARAGLDLGTPPFEQLVVIELLADPGVLTAQRQRLAARRDHLLQRLAADLPDLRADRPAGGLTLWVELPKPVSSRLAEAAEEGGVVITPGHRFFVDGGGGRWIRLPYTFEPDVLTDAVRRLGAAWRVAREEPAAFRSGNRTLDLIA